MKGTKISKTTIVYLGKRVKSVLAMFTIDCLPFELFFDHDMSVYGEMVKKSVGKVC